MIWLNPQIFMPRLGVKAVTSNRERTLRLSQSGLLCRSDFPAQVFRWASAVNRFLFLVTMSSASSDSEMNVHSEDSEIYYTCIAEDMK